MNFGEALNHVLGRIPLVWRIQWEPYQVGLTQGHDVGFEEGYEWARETANDWYEPPRLR